MMANEPLRRELATLLSSDLPGDEATLIRRLVELPPSLATAALYQIAVAARPAPPRLISNIIVLLVMLTVALPIALTCDLSDPLYEFLILFFIAILWWFFRITRQMARYLRYRGARRAVMYLAGFNDVRAIPELLLYRRRCKPGSPQQEKLEQELTRLFDELTGKTFIPGASLFGEILRKEYLSIFPLADISLTRAYFYIAMMRCLLSQNPGPNTPVVERIARRHLSTPNRQLVQQSAKVLLGQPSSIPSQPSAQSPTLSTSVLRLRQR
jgi:hypothetical protein